jgi:hypothetical protein
VSSLVPDRFEAYVRILHPAATADGSPIGWADVAAATGRHMHPHMQWHVLVGATDPDNLVDAEWSGMAPEWGDLSPEAFEPLCQLLGQHTTDTRHCFFGLWTGRIWTVSRAESEAADRLGDQRESIRTLEEVEGPRLRLPPPAARDYLLLAGPLEAASRIGQGVEDSSWSPTSPSIMWPAERSWFLVTDVDLDSTLVGGTRELGEAIVSSDKLEAFLIGPTP